MKTLILCVDRDNDFGKKAKVESPVIGRESNINAALSLGLKDAEDPDTNALLSAINMYDKFVGEGKDVEIATICGDSNVGVQSDRMLAKQLERVLEKINPDSAILVSDGAEDEYILPLIMSRIKVDSVKRVIMKQVQNIESTYYIIAKALRDEKIQRKFVIPAALFLLIICSAAIVGYANIGWAVVGFVIGTYLLISAFNLEDAFLRVASDFKAGLMTGRISLFTSVFAVLVMIVGLIVSYNQLTDKTISISSATSFVGTVIWWTIAAALIGMAGRALDEYVKEKRVLWSYWIAPFSLIILGLFVLAALDVINNIDKGWRALITLSLIVKIAVAVFIGFIGFTTYRYIKEHFVIEEAEWRQ
jgi:putative membrane protein